MGDGIPVFCAHDAIVKTSELKPNPKNPNQHPPEQVKLLGGPSVAKDGAGRSQSAPAVGDRQRTRPTNGCAAGGSGRGVPVDYQKYASEAKKWPDLVADNRIAESVIQTPRCAEVFADIDTGEIPFMLSGYTEEEYGNIVSALSEAIHAKELEDPDGVIEPPARTVTQYGDLWILGRHRASAETARSKKDRDLLLNGATPEILLTDPPYCSEEQGKRQEQRQHRNREKKRTRTDDRQRHPQHPRLSELDPGRPHKHPLPLCLYLTDWRMWVYLFDLVEASGFGVKQMLVGIKARRAWASAGDRSMSS
jgi:hypothetical protein